MYILETGPVQNAPSASLSPALWMLSSCPKLVLDAVPYPKHHNLAWNQQSSGTASIVSLSPPHFECATTRMRLRTPLHWALVHWCAPWRRGENPTTAQGILLIPQLAGVCHWSWSWGVSGLCVWVLWKVQLYIYGLQTWTHSLLPIPVWHSLPVVGLFLWCQGGAHENKSPDHQQKLLWNCPWLLETLKGHWRL